MNEGCMGDRRRFARAVLAVVVAGSAFWGGQAQARVTRIVIDETVALPAEASGGTQQRLERWPPTSTRPGSADLTRAARRRATRRSRRGRG